MIGRIDFSANPNIYHTQSTNPDQLDHDDGRMRLDRSSGFMATVGFITGGGHYKMPFIRRFKLEVLTYSPLAHKLLLQSAR